MERDIQHFHESNPGWPIGIYPYLVSFRGCPIDCNVCIGAVAEQKKAFRRGPVVRSASKLAEDLDRIEGASRLRFVHMYFDFITLMPESYAHEILRKPTRLVVHYEFAKPPLPDALELLLSSFTGGPLYFCMDDKHASSDVPVEPSVLIPLIKRVNDAAGYMPVLAYVGPFASKNDEYLKAVCAVVKATRCCLFDAAAWWDNMPAPDESGSADPASFESFMNLPWRERYFGYSFKGRIFMFLDRLLPASWASWLARLQLKLFHNLPFMLRFMRHGLKL